MVVFKHRSNRGRVAVTQDAIGASLPSGNEKWQRIGTTQIEPGKPYIGRSGNEVLADIEQKGYSVIPIDADA